MIRLTAIPLLLATSCSAFAQDSSSCGDPPPVQDESLKGELSGKAQLLSRFIGDAALSGKIQMDRREIFSRYGNASQARSDAYFEYQICVILMEDKQLSSIEKITQLKEIKREFSHPISPQQGQGQETIITNSPGAIVGSGNSSVITIQK